MPGKIIAWTTSFTEPTHDFWRGKRVVTDVSDAIPATDLNSVVTYENASPVAVTLPQGLSTAATSGYFTGGIVSFFNGWTAVFRNKGAGQVTITPATSTINGAASLGLVQNDWAIVYNVDGNYHALTAAPANVAVRAAAAFGADNVVIRSDGSGRGTQASGITIDDSDNLTSTGTLRGKLLRGVATGGTDPGLDLAASGSTNAEYAGINLKAGDGTLLGSFYARADTIFFALTTPNRLDLKTGSGGITGGVTFLHGDSSQHTTLFGKLNLKTYTVGTLPAGVTGATAYATNLRVFNGAGTQEGAAAGTGGCVNHNGTAWKIAGTNVTAIA